MQSLSLRLLHELNASSNNNMTNNSTSTNGTERRHFPGAIRHCFIGGEEEGGLGFVPAIPIHVEIYPTTSLAMNYHEGKLTEEKMEIDEIDENGEEIGQEEKENSTKWEPQQIELKGGGEENDQIDKSVKKQQLAKAAQEMAIQNVAPPMTMEGEREGDEEEDYEWTEKDLARFERRRLFPTETINQICMFLSFGDCNRQYTTCRLLNALLEPRRKVCMEVFIKRLDETRERLSQTIKEVDERRRHVNQLNDQIGTINARLVEMGQNLADLDAQILVNHSKLDELHERIECIRFPVQQKLEEEKEK